MKIHTGIPDKAGVYVAYIKEINNVWAKKTLLTFSNNQWTYISSDQIFRGEVLGYIGPLPALKIKQLKRRDDFKYAIASSIFDGIGGSFLSGPYDSMKQAKDEKWLYDDGVILCELLANDVPKPIRTLKNGKWKKIKKS